LSEVEDEDEVLFSTVDDVEDDLFSDDCVSDENDLVWIRDDVDSAVEDFMSDDAERVSDEADCVWCRDW
jgi:hypothetical protein